MQRSFCKMLVNCFTGEYKVKCKTEMILKRGERNVTQIQPTATAGGLGRGSGPAYHCRQCFQHIYELAVFVRTTCTRPIFERYNFSLRLLVMLSMYLMHYLLLHNSCSRQIFSIITNWFILIKISLIRPSINPLEFIITCDLFL